jgi:hypothetical protein
MVNEGDLLRGEAGYKVQLRSLVGGPVQTKTTDKNGLAWFTDLGASAYHVDLVVPEFQGSDGKGFPEFSIQGDQTISCNLIETEGFKCS